MKILIIGAWAWPPYEKAFARGLRDNGVEVTGLSVSNFFRGFLGKTQEAIPFPGLAMLQLNIAIVTTIKKQKPDLVLFWRPTNIFPKTIRLISSMGIPTVSYNNDDPFGSRFHDNVPWHQKFLWYWYKRCLPLFKYNFFYREINCLESKAFGVTNSAVLLPYFVPWSNHPVQLTLEDRQQYETDVVFVGHCELDGREGSIRALMQAGIRTRLWGGRSWSRAVLGDLYDDLSPIVPAEGDAYAKALCGAKVCLCFLSRLNRDTYTRRCFEIPACGRVMLAERTEDLMQFFKEDEEACFFSSPEELVEKALWLINNPVIRENIAQAGQRRVWADGHDVASRANYFLSVIKKEYHIH